MILLISPKQVYATRRLLFESKKLGLQVTHFDVKDLARLKFNIDISGYDLLYIRQAYPYLAEVIALAEKFKRSGKQIIDENIAGGDLGLGKMDAYERLEKAHIKIPQTQWLADSEPFTLNPSPCIVKWTYGFAGKEVFIVNGNQPRRLKGSGLRPEASEITNVKKKFPANELLIQELIFAKYEYKVVTVGFKSIPIVLKLKTNQKTFRPDFSTAKTISKQSVPQITKLAEQASRVLGRELTKVDIVETLEHQLYVLEVNRFPGLKSFEKLTGCNAAKDFAQYLKIKSSVLEKAAIEKIKI